MRNSFTGEGRDPFSFHLLSIYLRGRQNDSFLAREYWLENTFLDPDSAVERSLIGNLEAMGMRDTRASMRRLLLLFETNALQPEMAFTIPCTGTE